MERVLDAATGDNLRAVEADDVPTLDALAREGARRMLAELHERALRRLEVDRALVFELATARFVAQRSACASCPTPPPKPPVWEPTRFGPAILIAAAVLRLAPTATDAPDGVT